LIFFHVGVIAFLGVTALLLGGFIWWYGGIAAFFSAQPYLAVLLLGICAAAGLGYAASIKKIYDNKHVFFVIRDSIVNRYRHEFEKALKKINKTDSRLPDDHVMVIDKMVYQAVVQTLHGLMEKAKLTPSQVLLAPLRQLTLSDIKSWNDAFADSTT